MNDSDYDNMSEFSCGVNELDDFFQYEVRDCVKYRYLSAYCGIIGDTCEIVAAFTLMNDALMISNNEEKDVFIDDLRLETESETVDFFNRQSSYPAINIGHLGINERYQCQGIVTAIIDLVADTFTRYRQAGCQFITVDALNNTRTIKFYQLNGFSFQTYRDFYSMTRRMYRIL